MKQRIVNITMLVSDYDEAIKFYTEILDFELVEDTQMSPTKRWVLIAPPNDNSCRLLLAKATNDAQKSRVGDQTGGKVFLFLHTDNFQRDYDNLLANEVRIVKKAREEDYGKVLVFADLYGNLIDLIEPLN